MDIVAIVYVMTRALGTKVHLHRPRGYEYSAYHQQSNASPMQCGMNKGNKLSSFVPVYLLAASTPLKFLIDIVVVHAASQN
jgi:hypothetical protein